MVINETKIKTFGTHKKVCSKCLREVKTIWLSYNDLEKNIFIKQEKGICKLCLNKLIAFCDKPLNHNEKLSILNVNDVIQF